MLKIRRFTCYNANIDKNRGSGYITGMQDGLSVQLSGADARFDLPLVALQRFDNRFIVHGHISEENGPEKKENKKNILCKTCGKMITSDEEGIAINGSHEHTFMNPRGLVFHIGCFSGADNCHIMGAPTGEYTWFPGFLWCYVVCTGCLTHLGWHYQSGGGGFFGLILDHLVRE